MRGGEGRTERAIFIERWLSWWRGRERERERDLLRARVSCCLCLCWIRPEVAGGWLMMLPTGRMTRSISRWVLSNLELLHISWRQDFGGLCSDLGFLANLPELCDVTFLVGRDKEPVCAVKAILAARKASEKIISIEKKNRLPSFYINYNYNLLSIIIIMNNILIFFPFFLKLSSPQKPCVQGNAISIWRKVVWSEWEVLAGCHSRILIFQKWNFSKKVKWQKKI